MGTSFIKVGARKSPLSQVQIDEVLQELQQHHPEVHFEKVLLETTGDKDQKTSLRDMPACDFFTKEIEERQLQGDFRISIHSAKDLPLLLQKGLSIVALTKGVDARDAIVVKEKELGKAPLIATSSYRREALVQTYIPEARFCDIRGTISQRIAQMHTSTIDGVVIAMAALIRLNLTHLPHIILDGETAQFQGQLAVVARYDDEEMRTLFAAIDSRKPKQFHSSDLIEIVPLHSPKHDLSLITHLLFTSKNGAQLFFEQYGVVQKNVIAVGEKTKEALEALGFQDIIVATNETSEGIVELLGSMDLQGSSFFWPHSKKSRDVIPNFFREQQIPLTDVVLYDTKIKEMEPPALHDYNEIFFSSPSGIDAFLHFYGRLPDGVRVRFQGPVTEKHFRKVLPPAALEIGHSAQRSDSSS